MVLRRTAIYQRPDASIGDNSLEIAGSIANGWREIAGSRH
jgi:hypothetical protein